MKTTNKSFINMWRFLQRNNIENNLFMLETKRKELVDFSIEKYQSMDKEDPYFKIYKSLLIEEIKENIWFYFRELVVIPDDNSIIGYKHFELTPDNMMMIYLYDKQKSFVNFNTENELCLYFLWNRYVSIINNDIVLVNDNDVVSEISNTIRKHIASMECQIPIGSNQIISDHVNRYITCDMKSFKNYYLKDKNYDLIKDINKIYNKFAQRNHWDKNNINVFILENNMPIITYSYLIRYLNKDKYKFYLNGITEENSIDRELLKNFLTGYFATATTSIYDFNKDNLENFYVI
jgi:hypothetical protein